MKPPRMARALSALTRGTARPMSRDKADTLLLLTACALVLAPHAMHLPPWITVTCAMVLLWRGWVTFRGNRMPSRWLLLPVAALALFCSYVSFKVFFGRDSGVAMLALLLVFKLLEMYAKRDLFVIVFLSFFLMLTNFFYSQSIATALMMVLAVIAILTTQLSFQYTGAVPPLKRRLALGVLILGLAAPLTLVLFLLFPRIQGPLWGLPDDAGTARTGLSDSMAPGNIANLAQSDEVAFRVKFFDPAPPQSKQYWRGLVLGRYDGRTWTQLSTRWRYQRQITGRARGAPIRHQITLEPSGRPWIFALELPQSAPRIDGNPTGFSPDLQLLAQRPIERRVRYEAVSIVDFDLQPDETDDALQDWLQLPAGFNPNTLAFAARLRQQYPDNVALLNATLAFFNREKFSYTLEPPLLGQHAVDEFLFATRAGFCEHYASAFTVLMRAAGIPARVVTGYQGGEVNPVDGFTTVRQSDAHAWAEVWLKNRGWIRVDPTAAVAPERIQKNLRGAIPRRLFGGLVNLNLGQDSWLGALRLNWDAVNNAWNQWVLNYTPERQRNLLQSLGFEEVDWRTLTVLMFVASVLVMSIIAIPLMMSRQKVDPAAALYASLCQLMARRGCARAPHEGPRAYAARLYAAPLPLAADKKTAAAHFLALYEALQYGEAGKTPPAAAIAQLKSLLADCR